MIDEHVIEAIGMTRIVIQNGNVVKIEEPKLHSCPLAKQFATPVDPITKDSIKLNISDRINRFGMCTKNRMILSKDNFVLFGASELMSSGLRSGRLDGVVIACDGAGTVVTNSPEMTQGIGGRMSGLVSTTPYKEVIQNIEQNGGFVISNNGLIDPIAGLNKAKELGWTNVAVTITGQQHELAEKIRSDFPNTIIIVVHTSSISSLENASRITKVSDLVYACASKYIRQVAKSTALIQGGISIPIFATSKKGKMLIIDRLIETNQQILVKSTNIPDINSNSSPEPLI